MNNLASFYWMQHRYMDAHPYYVKTLDLSRQILGEDHPNTLRSMHNLASSFEYLGQSAEAERLYLSALERKRHVYGKAHPLTSATESALVRMYVKQRRFFGYREPTKIAEPASA